MSTILEYLTNTFSDIPSLLTTVFGGGSFIAWISERRKRRIEENQLGASALESMQNAYDKFTKDSLERYTVLESEFTELRKELYKNKLKYNELKTDYDNLKIDYNNLQLQFNQLKEKNNKIV